MDRPKVHQLRVHFSRVAGFPILGDVAYTKGTEDRGAVGSRMCLHVKELVIPLIGGQVFTFTAKDPFCSPKVVNGRYLCSIDGYSGVTNVTNGCFMKLCLDGISDSIDCVSL